MEYRIDKVLSVSKKQYATNAWKDIENQMRFKFPPDYKTFIDSYGEGGVNEFLWSLSPFSKCDNLNLLVNFKEMRDAYIYMKKQFPEDFSLEFYNGRIGLFPWGVTDNGDELYWNVKEDTVELVVYESRYSKEERYLMDMTEFLFGLLDRSITCSIFPDDFILDSNYYRTI